MFLAFLIYEMPKNSYVDVLRIESPTQIVVDINNNGVEDENEIISLKKTESFSVKSSKKQDALAKKLKINPEDAIGLGYLAQNFAKETLEGKKVKIVKSDSNSIFKRTNYRDYEDVQIIINGENYQNLLFNQGLAVGKNEKITPQLKKNIDKVRKLNLIILNNKNHKYHKLTCKYGLIAHNAQIMPVAQLPQDAKPCKFCFGRHKNYKKHKPFKLQYAYYADVIPNIKSPATVFQKGPIKIFLTDMTKVLKPSKSCSTPVCRALLGEINSAQNSIDFAIYGYSQIPDLQRALQNAQNRGVRIRFVYDAGGEKDIYPDTSYLTTMIKNNNSDTTSAFMHDKFFIFDNKTVLTGSANISSTDMSGYNSNAIILINSPEMASIYSKEFEQMYNSKFHKQKRKIKSKQFSVGDSDFSVFFAPKDKALANDVVPILDGAKKYIYMPAFLLTHKQLTQCLLNAAQRGVAVKVILDATNTHVSSSKMRLLRQHGIQVKVENYAGKLHSKSIIIDDTYTIIGSMNFSRSGESSNDENLLIIKNKDVAIFYKHFFQYLWQRIPDKWLKYNARAESPDSIGSCSDGVDNDFDGKIDKADESCKPYKKVKNKSRRKK